MARVLIPLLALSTVACSNSGGFARKHPAGDSDGVYIPDTTPPVAVCRAEPAVIEPGTTASFIGEDSHDPDGNPLIDYSWSLLTMPEGAKANLPPGQANIPDFAPDIAGEYVARLIVYNDHGGYSETCDAALSVAPSQVLYVEARADNLDDIQLILIKGKHAPESPTGADICNTSHCKASWGAPAASPKVLRDGSGDGLLAIAVEAPSDGIYTLALWDGSSEKSTQRIGQNPVWVHVFIDGERVLNTGTVITGEPGLPDVVEGSLVAPLPIATLKFPEGTVTQK